MSDAKPESPLPSPSAGPQNIPSASAPASAVLPIAVAQPGVASALPPEIAPEEIATVAAGLLTPGHKTTEFWICLGLICMSQGQSLIGSVPPAIALKYSAGLAVIYTIARFILKVLEAVHAADERKMGLMGQTGPMAAAEGK